MKTNISENTVKMANEDSGSDMPFFVLVISYTIGSFIVIGYALIEGLFFYRFGSPNPPQFIGTASGNRQMHKKVDTEAELISTAYR